MERALYDASFNVLQLSRNRQTVYTYKANNIGRNLFSDQQKLASGNGFDRVTDSNPPIFLPLPEPAMPLSQKGCYSMKRIQLLPTACTDWMKKSNYDFS